MAKANDTNSFRGGGSVFQRKRDGKWLAKYQNSEYNGGQPILRTANAEKEAYAKLELIKQELFGGRLADGTTADAVAVYIKRWLSSVKKNRLKPQSYDRLESTVMVHIIPTFGAYLMTLLSTDEIQDFANY